jgi:AraC-like DNA-binding protein
MDPRREEIDAAMAGGQSVPKIAAEFGLPESNLYRHRKDHLTMARSITTSRAGGVVATVERLEALDQHLGDVYQKAMSRGHTQAAVAALAQRVKIVMEISGLRDEVQPQQKKVIHLHLNAAEAERIAMSYMRHKQLTGGEIETEGK